MSRHRLAFPSDQSVGLQKMVGLGTQRFERLRLLSDQVRSRLFSPSSLCPNPQPASLLKPDRTPDGEEARVVLDRLSPGKRYVSCKTGRGEGHIVRTELCGAAGGQACWKSLGGK
eukprot:1389650-Rhodomonas_salina.5